MTEVFDNTAETGTTATEEGGVYEKVRDTGPDVPKAARVAWRDADRWASYIAESYRATERDEMLSDEGKRQRVSEVYEQHRPRVEKAYADAKREILKDAQFAEEASLPAPGNSSMRTSRATTTTDLLAAQGERDAILARIRARQGKLPAGWDTDAVGVIKEAFGNAVSGEANALNKARAEGAVLACEALGINVHDVVGDFRQERHHAAYDKARRLREVAQIVPSARVIPEPPSFSSGFQRGGNLHTAGGQAFVRSRPPLVKQNPRKKNPFLRNRPGGDGPQAA